MDHVLSVFKFSFPFIEYKYEEAIFYEIISDFEKLLKYHDIYLETSDESTESHFIKIVYFTGGRYEFYLNTDDSYYIPKYRGELFLEEKTSYELTSGIIKIHTTLGLHNYIFDYGKDIDAYIHNKNVITQRTLEENFKFFNEKRLKEFLLTIDKKYLSETLKNNTQIRNSFYFMIYTCYHFYQNYRISEKQLSEISNLKQSDISEEYSSTLDLSAKRLEYINNINITTFKKYSIILDSFFDILK